MLKSEHPRERTALPGPERPGLSLGAVCLGLRSIMLDFKIFSS